MVTFLILFFGMIPAFAWLMFYLHEDLHPEPRRVILWTFIVGAAFSIIALGLQLLVNALFIPIETLSPASSPQIFSFITIAIGLIIFAGIEEIIKFTAAYVSVHKNPAFDEPVDAMIYTVVAALGFATVENIGVLNGISPYHINFFGNVFETLSLRFIGATLLHTLTSGIVGYFWAISIREFNAKRFIVGGLVIATVLHACFNYLILIHDEFAYPVLLVLIVGFFVLNDFESLNKKAV
ncbi:MAG: PrsW family intramembrane metalloprotease [Patescibacteria group bacterium]|nr:PrsW family intramembrane metalloprotease [Patescibacteria group bacterium]